jgi:hypothetical protein
VQRGHDAGAQTIQQARDQVHVGAGGELQRDAAVVELALQFVARGR